MPATFQEPKGLYLLEAWATGLPVVQPDHGSFPELIEATQGGELFPAGDSTKLAESILKLLRDADQRLRWGQQGRQAVNARFTADVMAQATLRVLEHARQT